MLKAKLAKVRGPCVVTNVSTGPVKAMKADFEVAMSHVVECYNIFADRRALLASPHFLLQRYVRFGSMGKRPQDQGSPSSKRLATEQTPELPASERVLTLSMAWIPIMDDLPLISIFEHFANCYVAMPMVGTCTRIFFTWMRKRRQLALEELTNLRCWLDERELRNVRLFNRQKSGNVAIRDIYLPLCEIEALIR